MERDPTTPEQHPTNEELEQLQIRELATQGIERAHRYSTEVDDGTAAVLALGVRKLRADESPALSRFITRGAVDPGLRDEIMSVYTDNATSEETKEWINWLGTHILGRADTPAYSSEHYEELLTTTKELILPHAHQGCLGLLEVLTDYAATPLYIHDDLDRLESEPDLDGDDRVGLVWLRGILLNYAEAGERGPRGIQFPF